MDIQIILLGILQGLLEWLPVSSSGQASLFYSRILGLDPILGFKLGIAAHFGTGLSALVYFRRELKSLYRLDLHNIWLKIFIVPTIAALPIGFIIYQWVTNIESTFFEPLTGVALIITGLILYRFGKYGLREVWTLKTHELILVGIIEGLAIIPGLSRSALTITAFSLLGLNSRDSVRASFIMAIPVTILAGLYQLIDLEAIEYLDPLGSFILLVTSFLTGLIAIGFIYAIAKRLRENIALLLVILGGLILAVYIPLLL